MLHFSFRLRYDIKSQTDYHVGYIEFLHVVKKDIRKSGLGSALLRYTLSKNYNNIPCIELYAYPFDYTEPVARNEKLPKLLGFYLRHGGKILHQNSDSANIYFYIPNSTVTQITTAK